MEGRHSPELDNILGERTLGELVDAGEVIEELIAHPGWELVAQLLGEAYQRGMDAIQTMSPYAKPKDQAQYAQELGFMSGMRSAADAATTIRVKAERARAQLIQGAAEMDAQEVTP